MPLVTVIVTEFSPSTQVAACPYSTVVSPFLIETVAPSAAAVAVMVLVALVVLVVYSVTSPSKVGVSVSEPIVKAESFAFGGVVFVTVTV